MFLALSWLQIGSRSEVQPHLLELLLYVLGFAATMLLARTVWRVGMHCMIRTNGRGIEHLYVLGMDELLAKDAAFFHDNFAGSLTKRVLSFAARFEEFATTLVFSARPQLRAAGCRHRWSCGATTRSWSSCWWASSR